LGSNDTLQFEDFDMPSDTYSPILDDDSYEENHYDDEEREIFADMKRENKINEAFKSIASNVKDTFAHTECEFLMKSAKKIKKEMLCDYAEVSSHSDKGMID